MSTCSSRRCMRRERSWHSFVRCWPKMPARLSDIRRPRRTVTLIGRRASNQYQRKEGKPMHELVGLPAVWPEEWRRAHLLRHPIRVMWTMLKSGSGRKSISRTVGDGRGALRPERPVCSQVAHPTRFERVAFAFGGRRSIQLSYGCLLLTQCLRGFRG